MNFENLCIYPKPANPHVQVLVGCYNLAGGLSRPAIKFAIEHADGWNGGLLNTADKVKEMIQDFKATAKGAGKDLSKFDFCLSLRASIGKTEDEARENASWIAQTQTSMSNYAGYMHNKDETWRKAKGGTEAPKSNMETAALGTPEAVLKAVEEYVDAGINHFSVWFMYPGHEQLLSQMKLFSKEVMPSFR